MTYYMLCCARLLCHVPLFATPWTVACQALPSMGFSRQEYRSGWPFPSPGDLPNPATKPRSPTWQADSLLSETPGKQRYHEIFRTGLWRYSFICLIPILRDEIVTCMIIVCLTLKEIANLFSKVVVPFCIPLSTL